MCAPAHQTYTLSRRRGDSEKSSIILHKLVFNKRSGALHVSWLWRARRFRWSRRRFEPYSALWYFIFLPIHFFFWRTCISNSPCPEFFVDTTKTRLYNFDPLKPHFYIVKLGFTGVYFIFLISAQNIDCGFSLEPSRRGGTNGYPQSIFWTEIWKIIIFFLSENFQFLGGKIFNIYLNKHVFVMNLFKSFVSHIIWQNCQVALDKRVSR